MDSLQNFLDTIVGYFDYYVDAWKTFYSDAYNFICDLPVIILKAAFELVQIVMDWAGGYCSYCLGGSYSVVGGAAGSGGGSGLSAFAQMLQDSYSSLSPCVIYVLTMSGFQGCLQTLSCAMIIWAVMHVVSLLKALI